MISNIMQHGHEPSVLDSEVLLQNPLDEDRAIRARRAGKALEVLTSWAFYIWVTLQNVLATTTVQITPLMMRSCISHHHCLVCLEIKCEIPKIRVNLVMAQITPALVQASRRIYS